jgi:hypothetical protein
MYNCRPLLDASCFVWHHLNLSLARLIIRACYNLCVGIYVKTFNKTVIILAFVMASSAPVAGCSNEKVVPPPPQLFAPSPLAVTADELFTDYRADPAGADLKYKNKTIWLTSALIDSSVVDPDDYYFQMAITTVTAYKSEEGVPQATQVWTQFNTIYSAETYQIGNIVELIGRCQGITDHKVVITVDWINLIAGGASRPPPNVGGY